ncbi:MAG: hypothetical protein ACM3X0_10935 [Bacteroidota bacterium]
MLLDRYQHLFFNANFKEAASLAGHVAYRGEFVLKEGEVADAQGRRAPPSDVLKQAVLLADGDDLKLIAGSLDELQQFAYLRAVVGAGLKPGSIGVFFTVNIPQPFMTTLNGARLVFIPLTEGMAWNELIDLVGLEKADFKGQSSADKVVTVYQALLSEKFKFPEVAVEEALKTTNNARRVVHGAV